jgi:hypothetical protein
VRESGGRSLRAVALGLLAAVAVSASAAARPSYSPCPGASIVALELKEQQRAPARAIANGQEVCTYPGPGPSALWTKISFRPQSEAEYLQGLAVLKKLKVVKGFVPVSGLGPGAWRVQDDLHFYDEGRGEAVEIVSGWLFFKVPSAAVARVQALGRALT